MSVRRLKSVPRRGGRRSGRKAPRRKAPDHTATHGPTLVDAPLASLDRIHDNAVRLADEMEARAAEIGVEVVRLPNGARLVDAGVDAPGSYEAGRLVSEACLGGLGRVTIGPRRLGSATLSEARVAVSFPLLACMASQYAGWKIEAGKFFAMGSGPARSLAAAEPLFERYPLKSRSARSVLVLETSSLPGPEVADKVASRCGIKPKGLTLIAAATWSPVGSTQIAARSVETALHKLMELGFDLTSVVAGTGSCPIAPGIPDPLRAIGRTNDAVLYGSAVVLWVKADDRTVERIIERVPSSASRDYGRPFYELIREHGDFYKIDPLLFSPARITMVCAPTGTVLSAGQINEAMLLRSFGLSGPS
jgi:methenyltetrahydromethanopterin cyclohydrolase